jgi:hypothetical protein
MSASVKFFLHIEVEYESFTAKTMPDQIGTKGRFVTVLLYDLNRTAIANAQRVGSVPRQCAECPHPIFLLYPSIEAASAGARSAPNFMFHGLEARDLGRFPDHVRRRG